MTKFTFLIIIFLNLFYATHTTAQGSKSSTAALLSRLEQLQVTGTVLYVAAHPDDENTRLLSYLANEKHYQTAYLSLTRGDGGQNLIGKEQGPLLGLIRTQELLEARKIDGAQQYFSRAYDFGYSKTPEETFEFWNKDSILSDVVWVIRQLKPDIIVCRFPTTGEGGHGHHTASAILALEAFKAAADPKRFTWQVAQLGTWQAKRILWNTFNFGTTNTTSEDQLKIDVGAYNSYLGKSYGELAAESRSCHKSQGFGTAKSRGTQWEYFKLMAGDSVQHSLMDGVNTTWSRFPKGALLNEKIVNCIKRFEPKHPEQSSEALWDIYTTLQSFQINDPLFETYRKQKLQALQQLIMDCSGFWAEASLNTFSVVPGDTLNVNLQWLNRSTAPVEVIAVQLLQKDTTLNSLALKDQLNQLNLKVLSSKNQNYSDPYWLRLAPSKGMFQLESLKHLGAAENAPVWQARLKLKISNHIIDLLCPIIYKSTDPVKGELYRAVECIPPVLISSSKERLLLNGNKKQSVSITVKAQKDIQHAVLEIKAPKNIQISQHQFQLNNLKKGAEQHVVIDIAALEGAKAGAIQLQVNYDKQVYQHNMIRVAYDHIAPQFKLEEANIQVVPLNIKTTQDAIAYIAGAGDALPECLEQLSYKVDVLKIESLSAQTLAPYKALVMGIRAYNMHSELAQYYDTLMQYVHQGGNLIVQYNTNNRLSTLPLNIGPYPFVIGRERVTDENATVKILDPDHPLIHYPNKITDLDFDSWIQERGIYFAQDIDPHYTKVFSMQDAGQAPQEGSLILCAYGKGNFVYTGLSLFRQLPAAVSGAYRLLVNLLALPTHQ